MSNSSEEARGSLWLAIIKQNMESIKARKYLLRIVDLHGFWKDIKNKA